MSVDVEIVGVTGPPACWEAIRCGLLATSLPSGTRDLLGESPRLLTLGTNQLIEPNEQLVPGRSYYLELRENNTLGLGVEKVTDPDDPLTYVEDYGRNNLNPTTIQELAERWKRAGYSYNIRSQGGRHPCEWPLFVALAAVLAELSGGIVMVEDNGLFGVEFGGYPPDVFRQAVWAVPCGDERCPNCHSTDIRSETVTNHSGTKTRRACLKCWHKTEYE